LGHRREISIADTCHAGHAQEPFRCGGYRQPDIPCHAGTVCGQPEPAPGWDLLDGMLERRCWDVVAFVRDHQPVPGGEGWDVFAAGQGLQGDDVDDSFDLRAASAELPCLDPEIVTDAY
jgi:hypothetical protein